MATASYLLAPQPGHRGNSCLCCCCFCTPLRSPRTRETLQRARCQLFRAAFFGEGNVWTAPEMRCWFWNSKQPPPRECCNLQISPDAALACAVIIIIIIIIPRRARARAGISKRLRLQNTDLISQRPRERIIWLPPRAQNANLFCSCACIIVNYFPSCTLYTGTNYTSTLHFEKLNACC